MRRAAIVMPLRTPIGLPGGALSSVPPERLIATVIRAVTERSGLDPARIETLVTAVPEPHAPRAAAALSGISPIAGEFPIGGGPGSGLRALITAAMMIQSGAADIILTVGAEYDCPPAEFAHPGTPRHSHSNSPATTSRPSSPPPAARTPETVTRSRPGVVAAMLGAAPAADTPAGTYPQPAFAAFAEPAANAPAADTRTQPSATAGAQSAAALFASPDASTSDRFDTGAAPSGAPVFAEPSPSDLTPPGPSSTGAARRIAPAGADEWAVAGRGNPPYDVAPRPRVTGPTTGEQAAVLAAAESSVGTVELESAETLAQRYGISRVEADEFAATSHRRAARARRQGFFGEETAPVVYAAPGGGSSGAALLVDRDEGLRDDVSPRAFALLPPLWPGGILTAGNSSARALAASACLVVAEDRLADLGLAAMGFLTDWTTATSEPAAAVPAATSAIAKALWHTGFDLDDLDLLAVDETSAVEVLALMRSLGYEDPEGDRLNVHGGTLALGDPGGASGLCMITTLLHELSRCAGGYGLAAAAAGPARAVSVIIESAYAVPVEQAPRGARFHGVRARRSGRHRA